MDDLTREQEGYLADMLEQIYKTLFSTSLINLPTDWDGERETIQKDVPARFHGWQGMPFDQYTDVDNLAAGQTEQLDDEVEAFLRAHWDVISEHMPADVGDNYVLSRNNEGTGFWDTYGRQSATWDEATGKALHAAVENLPPLGLTLDTETDTDTPDVYLDII